MGNNILMIKKALLFFILFYVYAALRYHFGKGLGLDSVLFVFNKSFAWTAGTFFAMTLLPSRWFSAYPLYRSELGKIAYGFSLLHIGANLVLINPRAQAALFDGTSLNLHGWYIVLMGIITFIFFSIPLIATFKRIPSGSKLYKFGKVGVISSLIHVTIIGLHGWFNPNEWPYYLPPITLLFVGSTSIILVFRTLWK